eukprot:GHVQ01015720.1.p1 GENE.GHVQ01015720.1~~GHVQ01015720.1.p1  ORF type:complete len:246 (+),score=36.45 GHVQ01015720.1:95-832(+)
MGKHKMANKVILLGLFCCSTTLCSLLALAHEASSDDFYGGTGQQGHNDQYYAQGQGSNQYSCTDVPTSSGGISRYLPWKWSSNPKEGGSPQMKGARGQAEGFERRREDRDSTSDSASKEGLHNDNATSHDKRNAHGQGNKEWRCNSLRPASSKRCWIIRFLLCPWMWLFGKRTKDHGTFVRPGAETPQMAGLKGEVHARVRRDAVPDEELAIEEEMVVAQDKSEVHGAPPVYDADGNRRDLKTKG